MIYSDNTIKKTISAMTTAQKIAFEKWSNDPKSIKCHISGGNMKIGNTINFSLLPILDCTNCSTCLRSCYALKAIYQKGYNYESNTTLRAWAENSVIARNDPSRFIKAIAKAIKDYKSTFVRGHVSGDFFNAEYFRMLVNLAKDFPSVTFQYFTKSFKIVNEYLTAHNGKLPSNFILMYSGWIDQDITKENPFNMPIFSPINKEGLHGIPEGWQIKKCPGKCEICQNAKIGCIGAKRGTGVIVDLH